LFIFTSLIKDRLSSRRNFSFLADKKQKFLYIRDYLAEKRKEKKKRVADFELL
jgi:hypothetical protein